MLKTTWLSNNKVVGSSSNISETVLESFIFKKAIYLSNIRAIGESNFLTPYSKRVFNDLRQVFIRALIL